MPSTNKKFAIPLLAAVTLLGASLLMINLREEFPEHLSKDEQTNQLWLAGGEFLMGSEIGEADESPQHPVTLDGFWIDQHEVTNAEFEEFVEATGFVTFAEKIDDSLVFIAPDSGQTRVPFMSWWHLIPEADWQHPLGAQDSIEGKEDHPVVHIGYDDAAAYCDWRGMELPTEAQYEYAARGGLEGQNYTWGNIARHHDHSVLNHWQGEFPFDNTPEDGYNTTAPVGSYEANGFELYDMAGNVWEWVSDWYHPDYYRNSPSKNPTGVMPEESYDPQEPGIAKRSIRGGSFLCADNYCSGFRPSARMPTEPNSGAVHIGFRCVNNSPKP